MSAQTAPARKVFLVGAGPGDPELLTLKAARVIGQAEVLLVDDLVSARILELASPQARIVRVGKRGGRASTDQAFIERLLVREALAGHQVVRLKGGDPFVFGRGGEEVSALQAAGIEVEVVPGITAGIAAPASMGIPVTDRRWSQGVLFVTGQTKPGATTQEMPDWAALARTGLTLVIYMGVSRAETICAQLMAAGMSAHTPAAVVQHGCTPEQRAQVTTLEHLAGDIETLGLGSPAILIIGDVVKAAAVLPQVAAPIRQYS